MGLKELRKSCNLTQQELAEASGLKQSTISQYEGGTRTPPLSVAKKLAAILGVTLDDLAAHIEISKKSE